MSCVTPRSARHDSSPCWESTASMLEAFVTWLLDRFRDLGYPGIVVLMAVESSILPLPSELVLPPAGPLAGPRGLSAPGEVRVDHREGARSLGTLLCRPR